VAIVAALSPVQGRAADAADTNYRSLSTVEKKTPGRYYTPAKSSPAEQLSYADSLKAKGKNAKAGRLYQSLVHTWHDSEEAPIAQMKFAALMEEKKDYEQAFKEYEYCVRYYSGSISYRDILAAEFRVANAVLGSKPRFLLVFSDDSGPDKALAMFRKIVENGPNWEQAPEAQLIIGRIYEQQEEFADAVREYETLMQNYPNSDEAAEAYYRIGNCLFAIFRKRPRDERSAHRVRAHLQGYLRKYPSGVHGGEVSRRLEVLTGQLAQQAYDRAVFYDKKARKTEAALLAYRDFLNKFPDSAMAESARQRVADLSVSTGDVPAGKDVGPAVLP